MADAIPTGGQYCVIGLVLQLLVGLDRGLRIIIDCARQDAKSSSQQPWSLSRTVVVNHILKLNDIEYIGDYLG